jgi:hypothetical protein
VLSKSVGAVGGGVVRLKVAVTVAFPVSENEHDPVPEHVPPLQPAKVEPLPGVSMQVMDVPDA